MSIVSAAQQGAPMPVSVDILVLPATGDPMTVAPVATTNTVIATVNATGVITPNAQCNRTATPDPGTPLVNPTKAEFTDPFNVGKVCSVNVPTGLPNGTGYRAVAVPHGTGGTVGPRSAVGIPSFSIQPVGPPAVLTNLVIRP